MAASILSLVSSYRDEYDAIPIARLIGKLNVLLRVHLAYEDTVLYPLMMRSGDGEAAATAHLFAEENRRDRSTIRGLCPALVGSDCD